MIGIHDFEFEHKMRDGRLVFVTGQAKVAYSCDCVGDSHDHIFEIAVHDVQPMYDAGAFDGPEIVEGTKAMHELELAAETHLYDELKNLEKEGVA